MNRILEEKHAGHDELIEAIFKEYKLADKEKYISLFLSSFNSGTISGRSALAAFAIMQSFPNHKFTLREGDELSGRSLCRICSNYKEIDTDIKMAKLGLDSFGGMLGFKLLYYYYYLLKINKLEALAPSKDDLRIFSEIIEIILEAEPTATLKKEILSKIGKLKGFKSRKEQRQALLETLGYCSILETEKHKGVLKQYINLAVAPSKTHSSDWQYPADFWKGENGINKEAFRFWFGSYPELKKFWE